MWGLRNLSAVSFFLFIHIYHLSPSVGAMQFYSYRGDMCIYNDSFVSTHDRYGKLREEMLEETRKSLVNDLLASISFIYDSCQDYVGIMTQRLFAPEKGAINNSTATKMYRSP